MESSEMEEESGSTDSNGLIRILAPEYTHLDEIPNDVRRRSAWLTRDLERSGRDKMLIEACSIFLEVGRRRLGTWNIIEQITLNNILREMLHVARLYGPDNTQIASFGLDFDLDPAKEQTYSRRLAKFFRIFMEEELGNHHMIEEALRAVLQTQNDPSHEGDICERKEFRVLVATLGKTLYAVAINNHSIMAHVVQHLLFEESTWSVRDRSTSEDDSGRESAQTIPLYDVQGRVITHVRDVTAVRETLTTYRFGLEIAIGMEIERYRQALRQPMTGTVLVVETDRPFERVSSDCRRADMSSYTSLAAMIVALNALIKISPRSVKSGGRRVEKASNEEGGVSESSANEVKSANHGKGKLGSAKRTTGAAKSLPSNESTGNSTGTKSGPSGSDRSLYDSVGEVLIGYDTGKLDARSTMEEVRKITIREASKNSGRKRIRPHPARDQDASPAN